LPPSNATPGYDDECNVIAVERNKPSIKELQRDMRVKVMKTDRREKQGGNQETNNGNNFWNTFMITLK
jgi:hypothetical protein